MATNLNDVIVTHDNSTPSNGTKHGVKKSFKTNWQGFCFFWETMVNN
jgi:hypothetical protein